MTKEEIGKQIETLRKQTLKLKNMTYEIKETIREALRFRFDMHEMSDEKSIELTEAMKEIDHEAFLEMVSDLESEGINHNFKI